MARIKHTAPESIIRDIKIKTVVVIKSTRQTLNRIEYYFQNKRQKLPYISYRT